MWWFTAIMNTGSLFDIYHERLLSQLTLKFWFMHFYNDDFVCGSTHRQLLVHVYRVPKVCLNKRLCADKPPSPK